MKGITKPDNFITSRDKILIFSSLGVVILCTVALSNPFTSAILNAPLLKLIPPYLAVIMFLIPFAMYYGIHINQQVKFNDLLIERQTEEKLRKKHKLLFHCRFTSDEKGTVWEITNANKFGWHNAKLFIERTFEGEKITRKLTIGDLPTEQKIRLEADLVDIECARWRVMVISKEGQSIDFPDRMKQSLTTDLLK